MNLNKFFWAIAGVIAISLKNALDDGRVDHIEIITIGSVVLAAVATYIVPNTDLLFTAKTWVNALSMGSALLATLVGDGLVASEWLDVIILVLTTAGVYMIPNQPIRVHPSAHDQPRAV